MIALRVNRIETDLVVGYDPQPCRMPANAPPRFIGVRHFTLPHLLLQVSIGGRKTLCQTLIGARKRGALNSQAKGQLVVGSASLFRMRRPSRV